MRAAVLVLAVVSFWCHAAEARQAPPPGSSAAPAPQAAPVADIQAGRRIWTLTGGNAWGVELFHSDPGHNYTMATLSWGTVLTGPKGPGALRGHFEWALEAVPVFSQRDPQKLHGFGFTPLLWRWNFVPRGRVAPFAELAGGGLWTSDPIPTDTTTSNWTAHAGFGVRVMTSPGQGLVLGYRFHHISNGNRLEKNPGVNAHIAYAGWTIIR